MNDLDEIYKQLARDWPSEELAARYATAQDHGAHAIKNPRPAVARALPMVASALPPAATLDVAVYVTHMLRATTHDDLARRLVDNARQSAAPAPHRCHRALELDGVAHNAPPKSGCRSSATAPRSSSSPLPKRRATNDGARGPGCDQLAHTCWS